MNTVTADTLAFLQYTSGSTGHRLREGERGLSIAERIILSEVNSVQKYI